MSFGWSMLEHLALILGIAVLVLEILVHYLEWQLPFKRLKGRLTRFLARQKRPSRETLEWLLATGSCSLQDAYEAVGAGILALRPHISILEARAEKERKKGRGFIIELYGDPFEGKTCLLAYIAHRRHWWNTNCWCDYGTLQGLLNDSKLSLPSAARLLNSFPITRLWRRPWIYIDGCPASLPTENPGFTRWLLELRDNGIEVWLPCSRPTSRPDGESEHQWIHYRILLGGATQDFGQVHFSREESLKDVSALVAQWERNGWIDPAARLDCKPKKRLLSLMMEMTRNVATLPQNSVLRFVAERIKSDFASLDENCKKASRMIALAQMLDTALPWEPIASCAEELRSGFSYVRVETHPIHKIQICHLAGPVLARWIWEEWPHADDYFAEYAKNTFALMASQNEFRFLARQFLNHLRKGWLLPSRLTSRAQNVAVQLYREGREFMTPPSDCGITETLAWAGTFSQLGDQRRAVPLYWSALDQLKSLPDAPTRWLELACVIEGLKSDELPKRMIDDQRTRDLVLGVYDTWKPTRCGPRLVIGLADGAINFGGRFSKEGEARTDDQCQRTESMGLAHQLFAHAEKLASYVLGLPPEQMESASSNHASNALARLVGTRRYTNSEGIERPHLPDAIKYLSTSFELPEEDRWDVAKLAKSPQDILSHHTAGILYGTHATLMKKGKLTLDGWTVDSLVCDSLKHFRAAIDAAWAAGDKVQVLISDVEMASVLWHAERREESKARYEAAFDIISDDETLRNDRRITMQTKRHLYTGLGQDPVRSEQLGEFWPVVKGTSRKREQLNHR